MDVGSRERYTLGRFRELWVSQMDALATSCYRGRGEGMRESESEREREREREREILKHT